MSEQPKPTAGVGPEVWPLVIAEVADTSLGIRCPGLLLRMRARDQVGRDRYGEPLRAGNGRDNLRDALEEALDLVAYTRAECVMRPNDDACWFLHYDALRMASTLHRMLCARDGQPR